MNNKFRIALLVLLLYGSGCHAPEMVLDTPKMPLPEVYPDSSWSAEFNSGEIPWKDFFEDPNLIQLIDSALLYNRELRALMQEMEVCMSEIQEKKGEYLPFVNVGGGAGMEKPGRFTRDGVVEHELSIEPDRPFPEPVGDFTVGAFASWEVDIWKRLRNAKTAAEFRYLAMAEGRHLFLTRLVAEIASTYYELVALDQLLGIVVQNVSIQSDALSKMKVLRDNAQANQLAVNRFEAQLLNTTNKQYEIRQHITVLENRLRVLIGQPDRVKMNRTGVFLNSLSDTLFTSGVGIPSRLLTNRPDIRRAEYQIASANLEVEVARAEFFPKLDVRAGIGFQAFHPSFLLNPESIVLNAAGDLMAPLVNKNAINARFSIANALQIQTLCEYEQTVLQAYTEVVNQLSRVNQYSESFSTKRQEVEVLNTSVEIASQLFQYARADYVEVLLTQEELLDAQMELVEISLEQVLAKVHLYEALGGGWQGL